MDALSQHIELKGSVFTLLVLHPLSGDLGAIGAQLDEKLEQLPGFFADAPMVIDLQRQSEALPLDALRDLLRERGLVPVGVRNLAAERREEALAAGLGILPEGRAPATERTEGPAAPEPEASAEPAPPASTPPPVRRPPKIVATPVRSGQQVYSPGDLILLAPVSSGGEVLADGHIHAYAPLRGRALAGIRGDEGARIFCRSLEAELVSVAGNYRLADDIDESLRGRSVQILLNGERLEIQPL
ncbi:septum site-determining protein MinC [Endothiovibrio diazotrophicus]